ncbi:MAG: rhomboid family intramembrane serine protease [Gemmatimonadota bacterium]
MSNIALPRMTRWVWRLIVANSVIALLMATVLTSSRVSELLMFDPGNNPISRPWTFVTYMFIHGGLFHLLGNMVGLYFFGTAVEHRMGSRSFLLYYLYCGVGAAVFSLGLSSLGYNTPFLGSSGAVLGVALAFAMFWPDAEILVFPIPIPIKARTLVIVITGVSTFFGLIFRNSPVGNVAHLAHLGGILAGYIFFRVQAFSQRVPATPPRQVERVVMVQSSSREIDQQVAGTSRGEGRTTIDPLTVELDRVLDKINEKGISSLTVDERRFLDEVARRKQKDMH